MRNRVDIQSNSDATDLPDRLQSSAAPGAHVCCSSVQRAALCEELLCPVDNDHRSLDASISNGVGAVILTADTPGAVGPRTSMSKKLMIQLSPWATALHSRHIRWTKFVASS
jgi:hypothetical protein